jgi:glycerate kinase
MADGAGHVLLASDKFKGSLTAEQVASSLARGLRSATPDLQLRVAPVADGGEGTIEAAVAGGFTRRTLTVQGPLGDLVQAAFAIRGGTAVVELAQASGLRQLTGKLRPLTATSAGTGELIRAALDAGCTRIVLGVGGSASTDGGAGMLQVLGAGLLDGSGRPLELGDWSARQELARVDLSGLDRRLATTEVVLARDVDNVLLGPNGAAAVFGPQKGATAEQVMLLDEWLARWAELVGPEFAHLPGAGAAGGVGFAALAGLGAQARSGIELLLELTGFEQSLAGARLVVTGEGSLDAGSLGGKAPIGVARAAGARGITTVAVAGRSTLTEAQLTSAGIAAAYSLVDLEPDLARCISRAGSLLERVGERIASEWLSLPMTY